MNKFYFEKIDIRTIILHKVLKHIHNGCKRDEVASLEVDVIK